jgi:hypothetical protein
VVTCVGWNLNPHPLKPKGAAPKFREDSRRIEQNAEGPSPTGKKQDGDVKSPLQGGLAGALVGGGGVVQEDEGAAVGFADVVDSADVWMIEGGSGLGFALEAGESLRVGGDVFGEEFEGDEAMEAGVFGFVDNAHAAAEFVGDVVVGEVLTDQRWAP